jgi:hypothetical protein
MVFNTNGSFDQDVCVGPGGREFGAKSIAVRLDSLTYTDETANKRGSTQMAVVQVGLICVHSR